MNAPLAQIRVPEARPFIRVGAIAPPLEKLRLQFYSLQLVADISLLFLAHAIAGRVFVGNAFDSGTLLVAKMMTPLYLTIAFYNSTYSLQSLADWKRSCLHMTMALILSAVLLSFIAFYVRPDEAFSRGVIALGLVLSFVLMGTSRYLLTYCMARRFGPTLLNVLVIHDDGPPLRLAHAYHVSAAEYGLSPSLGDPHALDRLGHYISNMDRVVISCAPERRVEWSLALKGSGVRAEVISDFARQLGVLDVNHYDQEGYSSLVVSTGPLGMRARIMKRLFDLCFAALAIAALSPLFLIVSALIRAEDGGSILFCQRRLGRGNRFFSMYKFRTMTEERCDADGNRSASRDDDRITRIGRILRRTSLDELPQLFNVLRGQMSIVGPRPHAIGSQAGTKLFWEVDTRYWQRHSLKPGLTGLAQIRGLRGATHEEADLQERLQSDLEYINGWSIWRDLRIILMTLRVMVHHRAY